MRERWVRQRTHQIAPDPRLVPQILRLAVAAVEPCKGSEKPGVALRRHHRVDLGEASRIEAVVGHVPCLDVTRQQRKLELLGYVDTRILQQRDEIVGGRTEHGVLEIDDAYP